MKPSLAHLKEGERRQAHLGIAELPPFFARLLRNGLLWLTQGQLLKLPSILGLLTIVVVTIVTLIARQLLFQGRNP
jgi:hypothetical protein